ncbi:CoA pyrophosphatase [uncultured Schumannella sp.]|uniref:NUDIX hydrolase n=1 Tax=uncultured Schumannella sp. TaxID=1195956 RepID=UPI0025F4AD59|nr:CoA pyrophosphatase [uncultured Schumannella sp.]
MTASSAATPASARAQLEELVARAPQWSIDDRFRFPDPDRARRAAVLILFGVLDATPATAADGVAPELDVLLQRRAGRMRHHAGQVAFPGGGIDAGDASPAAAALREAVEETGLDPAGVDLLGELPEVPLVVSNNLVTPVLGWWTRPSRVAAVDEREAVEVFRVPVADLLAPENRASVASIRGQRRPRTPAFTVGEVFVWGFTAIVLDRLFDELGWTRSWDPSREVPVE